MVFGFVGWYRGICSSQRDRAAVLCSPGRGRRAASRKRVKRSVAGRCCGETRIVRGSQGKSVRKGNSARGGLCRSPGRRSGRCDRKQGKQMSTVTDKIFIKAPIDRVYEYCWNAT